MKARASMSIVAFFFVLSSVAPAQAGSFISVWGQTLCIDGVGNGTNWAWELRPLGGGAPFCSGVGSVVGPPADIVAATVGVIDGCAPDISAFPVASFGQCPAGMAAVSITRGPDTLNWELAIEDNTNPPNLKVPTPADPVFFNPGCRPSVSTPIPTPVPEPAGLLLLTSGCFGLFGLGRLRRR